MDGKLLPVIYFISLFFGHIYGMKYAELERLYENLTSNYNKDLRPIEDLNEALYVGASFSLLSIKDFEEKTSKLSIVGVFSLFWHDYKMKWDPQEFDGIRTFYIPQKKVWIPDITLANAYNTISPLGYDRLNIRVRYDGLMTWQPGDVYEVTCAADVTFYPFDEHTCLLFYVPWMYRPKKEVTMFLLEETVDTSLYIENGLWELKNTSAFISKDLTPEYSVISITFKRRPMFSVISMVIPVNVMGLLNVLVFLLPADSGERVGFSITVLLAMTVFLTIVSDNLPNTSQPGISRLCYILMADLVMSALVTLCVILGLCLHFKQDEKTVPNWLRRLVCLKRWRRKKRNTYGNMNKLEQSHKDCEYNENGNCSLPTVNSLYYSNEDVVCTGTKVKDRRDAKPSHEPKKPPLSQYQDEQKLLDMEGSRNVKWKDAAQCFDIFSFAFFLLFFVCKITFGVCLYVFNL